MGNKWLPSVSCLTGQQHVTSGNASGECLAVGRKGSGDIEGPTEEVCAAQDGCTFHYGYGKYPKSQTLPALLAHLISG